MERINKLWIIVGMAIAYGLFFEIAAHADVLNQETIITLNQPVDIPGHALPAGTYMFKVADNVTDQNMVQIFNADGTKLYATIQTIPTVRQNATSNTAITLAEQKPGEPDALLKWFYPGRLTGHQFVYPTQEDQQLAQDQHVTVTATPQGTNLKTAAGE
jgi:hypothetical protein